MEYYYCISIQKNQFIPSIHCNTANFRALWAQWPHRYLTIFAKKNFQSAFNFWKFVSTCKNQAINSFYSGNLIDLEIFQPDWLRSFWSISQELIFSHGICIGAWYLTKTFIIKKSSRKINLKIFQNIQETLFWTISHNFVSKKILFKKSINVMNNLMWVSNSMPKFWKNYWLIFKKTSKQTDGRMDRHYFKGLFL